MGSKFIDTEILDFVTRERFGPPEGYKDLADGLKKSTIFWLLVILFLLVIILAYNIFYPFIYRWHYCILKDFFTVDSLIYLYFISKYSVNLLLVALLFASIGIYNRKSKLRNIYYDKYASVDYIGEYKDDDPKIREKIYEIILKNSHDILDKKKGKSNDTKILNEISKTFKDILINISKK